MKRHKRTWSVDYMELYFIYFFALSFFLNLFTWEKGTREHIKEATLQNTPTSWNISILWFFFKAERCSYREDKSISTLTRPVNYIRGHLESVGDGSSNCMQTKQIKKKVKSILLSNCERAGQGCCVSVWLKELLRSRKSTHKMPPIVIKDRTKQQSIVFLLALFPLKWDIYWGYFFIYIYQRHKFCILLNF